MTDHVNGLTVVIEDMREDDCEALINAIAMLRGVIRVDKRIMTSEDYFNMTTAKWELRKQLRDLLSDDASVAK